MHSFRGIFVSHLYSSPTQGHLRQCKLGWEQDTFQSLHNYHEQELWANFQANISFSNINIVIFSI